MEKLFLSWRVNGFLSTGVCAEKRMLSTRNVVKLLFHSFPQTRCVDSTGGCGQNQSLLLMFAVMSRMLSESELVPEASCCSTFLSE